jgi:alpha-ketoglutarate-dependent taurine dioxygenase
MNGVNERVMDGSRRSPWVVESVAANGDLADFAQSHASAWEERLLEHGAILFRGFRMRQMDDFDRFVEGVSRQRLDYVYQSTPRTALGKRIFTATEYPPPQEIPLHNENSYQREWPLKLAFCCLVPAASGGETPIADMRAVTQAIGAERLARFEERGVRYVRHYQQLVDLPWQKVFQTEDRHQVARFCGEHDIAHEWVNNDVLRTMQVCQGVARNPATQERVFFNQAHLFHLTSLGEAGAKAMLDVFGPDRLPRQTYFGDGGDIPPQDLDAIRAAYTGAKFMFTWRAGDVLLVDNMQWAHGRRPFKGERKVIVALMDPSSGAAHAIPGR